MYLVITAPTLPWLRRGPRPQMHGNTQQLWEPRMAGQLLGETGGGSPNTSCCPVAGRNGGGRVPAASSAGSPRMHVGVSRTPRTRRPCEGIAAAAAAAGGAAAALVARTTTRRKTSDPPPSTHPPALSGREGGTFLKRLRSKQRWEVGMRLSAGLGVEWSRVSANGGGGR
eukprot:gene23916-biopygen4372